MSSDFLNFLFSQLTTASFIKKPEIMPLLIVTSAQWTLKHGYTEYSAIAFSWIGLLLGYFMGDFSAGTNLALSSLSLTKAINIREAVSRSALIAYTYVLHFHTPYEKCLEPLVDGYKAGMATGDVESGIYCVYFYTHFQFVSSKNLQQLVLDSDTYRKLSKDYGQQTQYTGFSIYLQFFQNLVTGPETVALKGGSFDEDTEALKLNDAVMQAVIYQAKFPACAFFGEFQLGADLAIEQCEQLLKLLPGQPMLATVIFSAGLCCFVASTVKTPKQRKYKQYANRCRNKLKMWTVNGNPNVSSLCSILDAEFELSQGRRPICQKHYEAAVLSAGRRGMTHFQALANERFAAYWMSCGNKDEAEYRIREALKLYNDWGARHKVTLLREHYDDLFQIPSSLFLPVVPS